MYTKVKVNRAETRPALRIRHSESVGYDTDRAEPQRHPVGTDLQLRWVWKFDRPECNSRVGTIDARGLQRRHQPADRRCGGLQRQSRRELRYDIENRLLRPGTAGSATPQYAFDANGQRIWRGGASPAMDDVTYWSGSQKLATISVSVSGATVNFALTEVNAYFGARLIAKGAVSLGGSNDKVNLASVNTDIRGSIGKFYP